MSRFIAFVLALVSVTDAFRAPSMRASRRHTTRMSLSKYRDELISTANAMVAPGKGLDEMFLPGTLSLDSEVQPKMEGLAPS